LWGGDGCSGDLDAAGFCGIYYVAFAVFQGIELIELIQSYVAFPVLGLGVISADLVEFGFYTVEEVFYGYILYRCQGSV